MGYACTSIPGRYISRNQQLQILFSKSAHDFITLDLGKVTMQSFNIISFTNQ
jgi:hypothetical protein